MRTWLLQGSAFGLPFPNDHFHCAITSPPYYGLRQYSERGEFGHEATLQEYVNDTVLWGREVWRVLRDDGTFWLNIGDSYARAGGWSDNSGLDGLRRGESGRAVSNVPTDGSSSQKLSDRFKTKDLMLVPSRVAIALQEDGWYLRSEIIWRKTNPMPEGDVKDRPHREHEKIYLFSKSQRYFYDAEAVREPYTKPLDRWGGDAKKLTDNLKDDSPYESAHRERDMRPNPNGRHRRTVWTFPTSSYPGAHYATFHPTLPETCIRAGTSEEGVCPVCGSQWERELEIERGDEVPSASISKEQGNPRKGGATYRPIVSIETVGWKPTCEHNGQPVPAKVLDPFGGSGTTAMVANQLGRIGVSIDLSWDYVQLMKERTGVKALSEWEEGRQAEANWQETPLFKDL